MKKEYFIIKGFSTKQYPTLQKAEDVCKKYSSSEWIIERHLEEIEEIQYTVIRKNQETQTKDLLEKIKTKLCNPRINLSKDTICYDFYYTFLEYAIKTGKMSKYKYGEYNPTEEELKICSEELQKYIEKLIDVYPVGEIQLGMLRTNYKPCNGIQIFFDECENYLKSGVYTDPIPDLCIEPHEIYPNNLCIQLRGDTSDKSIVIQPLPGACGRHVSELGEKYVDLDDPKTQVYINNVLNSLPQ